MEKDRERQRKKWNGGQCIEERKRYRGRKEKGAQPVNKDGEAIEVRGEDEVGSLDDVYRSWKEEISNRRQGSGMRERWRHLRGEER